MEIFLQITAFMGLVYALKVKMYKNNVVGFSTISIVCFLSLIVEGCNTFLVAFLSLHLLAICIYDFIKSIKRCNGNKDKLGDKYELHTKLN